MASKTVLSTATEGTSLSSLAIAARAISNTTGDLDNRTDKERLLDFELVVDAGTVLAGTVVAEVYILPSHDDTNFPSGDTSTTPAAALLVARFEAALTSGTQRIDVRGIGVSPSIMRFLLVNSSGNAYSAGTHTLKIKSYKYT